MTETPYRWDGDNVVLSAGFHTFTLAYIEPLTSGGRLLAIYGWRHNGAHVLPPQGAEREEWDPALDRAVEIPCRDLVEARAVVEAMFRARGWSIRAEVKP